MGVLFSVVLAGVVIATVSTIAPGGPRKTGGNYEISTDSLSGASGLGVSGSTYMLIYSAGQPLGRVDMTGGTYDIEGGFVSGMEAIFKIVKSEESVEAPAGYPGNPTDKVPGGRVTYKLEFTNYGEAAHEALVEDVVPVQMAYASSTIELVMDITPASQTDDPLDADECGYMVATSSVHCLIPDIEAGATGAVVFKAIID